MPALPSAPLATSMDKYAGHSFQRITTISTAFRFYLRTVSAKKIKNRQTDHEQNSKITCLSGNDFIQNSTTKSNENGSNVKK